MEIKYNYFDNQMHFIVDAKAYRYDYYKLYLLMMTYLSQP
jgi:hypothetical protein